MTYFAGIVQLASKHRKAHLVSKWFSLHIKNMLENNKPGTAEVGAFYVCNVFANDQPTNEVYQYKLIHEKPKNLGPEVKLWSKANRKWNL